jgi:hypothetical protein
MSDVDPGCVKTLRGINAPGILRLVVTLSAKKRKNSSSARCHDQIRFRFHTAWTVCGLGISVYSAASDALGNASTDKSKLPIDNAPTFAMVRPLFCILSGLRGSTHLFDDATCISALAEWA